MPYHRGKYSSTQIKNKIEILNELILQWDQDNKCDESDTIHTEMLVFPTRTEVENETTFGNGISPFPVQVFIL